MLAMFNKAPSPGRNLDAIAKAKGYHRHRRHIFLCVARGPCTNGEDASGLWEYLKRRLRELEPDPRTATVARTKSGCLRICSLGPIALVYPEGTLYHSLDENKLERIITEHLIGGTAVEEYSILSSPLLDGGDQNSLNDIG